MFIIYYNIDKSLQRSISCPNLNISKFKLNGVNENQFEKLLNRYLDKESIHGLKLYSNNNELANNSKETEYFKKLFYIYSCFKVIFV